MALDQLDHQRVSGNPRWGAEGAALVWAFGVGAPFSALSQGVPKVSRAQSGCKGNRRTTGSAAAMEVTAREVTYSTSYSTASVQHV